MSTRTKHHGRHIVFTALAVAFFLYLPGGVDAATSGNTAANENTAVTLTQNPRTFLADGNQNRSAGVGQSFGVAQSFTASALTVYLAKEGAPVDDVFVQLCVNPDWSHQTSACAGSTSQVIESWTVDPDDLVLIAAGQDTWAITLELPTDSAFFPGVSYGVVLYRTNTNDTTNRYRIGYTTGDFADGQAYWLPSGTCTGWQDLTTTSPGCAPGAGNEDLRFFLTYLGTGNLTVEATAIGGQIFVEGVCTRQSELPDGWVASNTIDLEYHDTSATGTWLLGSASCTDGTYEAEPRYAWNATYRIVARQAGDPVSFEAEDTVTVSLLDNPTENPVDQLGLAGCQDFSLLVDLDGAVGCYVTAFASTFSDKPPIQWWFQLASVFSATTTVPLELTFDLPGSTNTWTVYSSATDAGIVHSLDQTPEVLGMGWYELIEAGLWVSFGFYLLARARSIFV